VAQGELDDDDEAPLAEPPQAKPKKPDWGSLLQEEDDRQQDELKDQYQQMLNMDDPDQVDKAMKAAWHHMQEEDRRFTTAMQHTHKGKHRPSAPRAPPTALAQRSDRLFAAFGSEKIADEASHPHPKRRHRLMLNQRQATVRREEAGEAAKRVAAKGPPKEQRAASLPALAALPSAAALDAEAATATAPLRTT